MTVLFLYSANNIQNNILVCKWNVIKHKSHTLSKTRNFDLKQLRVMLVKITQSQPQIYHEI